MIGEHAAIAVMGPSSGPTLDQATDAATRLAQGLSAQGFAIIVDGDNPCARAAVQGATGQVYAVMVGDEPPPAGDGVEVSRHDSSLAGLAFIADHADALILFAGDLRATALLLQIWSYGTTHDAAYRQCVLVGDEWKPVVGHLADDLRLDQATRAMVTFASTPEEAVETIRYYVSPDGN